MGGRCSPFDFSLLRSFVYNFLYWCSICGGCLDLECICVFISLFEIFWEMIVTFWFYIWASMVMLSWYNLLRHFLVWW